MNNEELKFPRKESAINWWTTALLRLAFFLLIGAFFTLFILGPVYGIYNKGFKYMLSIALTCWAVSLLILIPAVRYYIIRRRKTASKIVIDSTGILFYNSKNEIVDKILYKELHTSNQDFDIYTVTPVGSGIVPLLEITLQPEQKDITKKRIDMNLPLYAVKNKSALYAHFMQGIAIFRPDLTIDPMALKSFSIDPNTWKVNNKGVSKGGRFLLLAVFIVVGIILGITRLLFLYKTGN